MIEYGNGCIGIIESSKKADFNMELQISCSHGIIYLPIFIGILDSIVTTKHRHCTVPWYSYLTGTYAIKKADAHQLQLENFIEVIEKRARPLIPLIESMVNIFTIEAIVKSSIKEKEVINIEIPKEIKEKIQNKLILGSF